ncbi:hypothetical protein [Pedococcus bigeumensis]|uniref:hypothetical protein n=1 Tax=Pedococcus bigeumensis TaxID=433644 RepID=UPI0031D01361
MSSPQTPTVHPAHRSHRRCRTLAPAARRPRPTRGAARHTRWHSSPPAARATAAARTGRVTAALCLVAGACLTAGRAEATTSTAPSSRTFAIGAATLDY